MAELKYSKEQIIELKKNKYVKNCTAKYLSFTDEFKIKALEFDRSHYNQTHNVKKRIANIKSSNIM